MLVRMAEMGMGTHEQLSELSNSIAAQISIIVIMLAPTLLVIIWISCYSQH